MLSRWSEARAAGDTFYFTGRPCPSGNLAKRQSSNGNCTCAECLSFKTPMSLRSIYQKLDEAMPVPESGCLIYMGSWGSRKYGLMGTRPMIQAHRASFERAFGPIPDGLFVCHKCDTPPCINPEHLFLGTNSDNMKDCVRKGRHNFGAGEKSPNAKITKEQALQIINSNDSSTVLARKYGISASHARSIRSGNCWKKLERKA